MCGTLAWRHCGQMLRAGMLIFHALARRLRDLDLEVFFFGTATVWQYYTLAALPPPHDRHMPGALPVRAFGPRAFPGAQDIEGRPAGVDLDLLAPALFDIAVGPAARADATAIGPAKGQQGQRSEQ